MPARLLCKKAFTPYSPSDWVQMIGLDCNDALWVWFKRRGVPSVCCLYPGTAGAVGRNLYDIAHGWPFAGEFVHRFLYRIHGYTIVQPPVVPCVGCGQLVSCCPDPIPNRLVA